MRSLNSELFPPIPINTAQAVRSVFPQSIFRGSNFYLAVGDQVDSLFSGLILDDSLDDSMERIEKPAQTLAMLYLITIFQNLEALPDHLAAEALQMRVDWKYALHLPMNYSGLDGSLLCEFRQWLMTDQANTRTMQTLLSRVAKVIEGTGKQCLCSENDRVIADVCLFSRLAKVWETIRLALEVVMAKQPELLLEINLPYWYIRYGRPRHYLNLKVKREDLVALAQVIGADGLHLLKAISKADGPELANLPEVLALQQVWQDQYEWIEEKLSWRKSACAYCYLTSRESTRFPRGN